jgi:SNF2 family DNA or RNA helicase
MLKLFKSMNTKGCYSTALCTGIVAVVVTASVGNSLQVTCSRGVKILADKFIQECINESWDLVVCPGGMPGATNLKNSDSLKEIIGSGESALVFTQFLQTLERTEKILKEAGIPVFVLHGAIPSAQRQKILRAFNEHPGGAVLVMTLKTGGVGLNLTKASYVFHLEPWWNPSVENQATDRAHRLGQKKAVQVFRYIMHESLEEKMEQLKERKSKKFLSLFSDTESAKEIGTGSSALSKEDFDFLLGIK